MAYLRSHHKKQHHEASGEEGHIRPRDLDPSLAPEKDLSALQGEAGNQATSKLVQGEVQRSRPPLERAQTARTGSGQPLSDETREQFEARLGQELSSVRLHTGSEAAAQADELNAQAFTRGDDIVVGSQAPDLHAPAGQELLAHELAHVLQQRQAVVQEDEISQAADQPEQQAEAAAWAAARDAPVQLPPAGNVPAIQREEKSKNLVSKGEVAAALEEFFTRSQQARRDKEFRITSQVRQGIELIFSEDQFGWLSVQSLLNRLDFPGDPGKFAQDVAAALSGPVDPQLVVRLKKIPVQEEPPGRIGRLKQLVERTKPAKGQRPTAPDPLASEKRFEQGMEDLRKLNERHQAEPAPTPRSIRIPPIDVLRAGRILSGLPQAIRGPKSSEPIRSVGELTPAVEEAIQAKVTPDALVPPGMKEDPGDFPDGQQVAREIARRLDAAQESGQTAIGLDLGNHYGNVKTMLPVLQELKRIAEVVKEALPHHARDVIRLDVTYAGKVAPIMLGSRESE
jgi:hypothetical protein